MLALEPMISNRDEADNIRFVDASRKKKEELISSSIPTLVSSKNDISTLKQLHFKNVTTHRSTMMSINVRLLSRLPKMVCHLLQQT